ncbi:MAG: ExeA family protein [Burkholderiales bacterium]
MNYLDYFGLREAPFGITPDTSFFCSHRSIDEALNTLHFAVTTGEGFIKITGEVGTGKTLLCRRFLATLPKDCIAAYIPNPNVNPQSLLAMFAAELGCRLGRGTPQEHRLLEKINRRLIEIADGGGRAIVCIDEAQAMPIATLETVRLLSNLETEKRKLLQVVLFGQPELDQKLMQPEIRQLRQRITFEYALDPLSRDDVSHYLSHRLVVAGYAGGGMFSGPAARSIYRASRGIPRLVNILAHKTLLLAYGRGRRDVQWRDARAAVRDTPSAWRFPRSWFRFGSAAVIGLFTAAIGRWMP